MSSSSRATVSTRPDLVEGVAERLLPSAARLVRLLVRQVRSSEISRTEMEVLTVLGGGPRSITELTGLEGTAQPTMTLMVKRLEAKGWVARKAHAADGRIVMIGLTEAGADAQARFREQFLAALRHDLEELSDEQLEALAAATETLDSFVEDLQRRTGR